MFWNRVLFLSLLCWSGASAQNGCGFYLVDHYNFTNNVGVALNLQSSNTGSGNCPLSSLNLGLAVGNGAAFNYAGATPQWQFGHTYTAKAVLTANGPQQLFLDGQLQGSAAGSFQPMPGALFASEVPSWANGPADYLVVQTGMQITSGSQTVSLPASGSWVQPAAPLLQLGGTPLWAAWFAEDPSQTMTITVTFQIQPPLSNPLQNDPYVDQYGQSNYGDWPSKVKSDNDLQAAIATEQTWLNANPPFAGLDAYGGSIVAGWHDLATGYYHTVLHNNRWWLITPLGNPCFYISLSAVQPGGIEATPVTGRTAEFAALPPQTGTFASAYTVNYWQTSVDQNTTFFHFDTANRIRKYGDQWMTTSSGLAVQRLASWGLAGVGKWSALIPGVPSTPVLSHSAVPNVAPGGHPDVFDPAIVAQLKATLTSQIGGNLTNPDIVGWSVGNEIAEDIQPAEIQAILSLGASVPAKQALVNQALSALYGGSVSALAAAWKITAATTGDIYAATTATPPGADIEALREFFEWNYYQTIYKTIKAVDPNHLYLGNWISPGYWVNATDWALIAANTDVIGFDYYAMQFLSTYNVDSLIQTANKPVMVGEFSFAPNYDGQRGFGSVSVASAETESESGDLYNLWLKTASAYKYCLGVSWFEYEDEPVSGEGNQSSSSVGNALVYGEDYAFGLVDVTDQPKYGLVSKVRAANQAALISLGLLNNMLQQVTSAAGGVSALAPGSLATAFGAGLATGQPAATTLPWPATVNGTSVTIVDSANASTPAPLTYVSSSQINFQIPGSVATGKATVTVTAGNGQTFSGQVTLTPMAPALFTLDAANLAAAQADCVSGGTSTAENVYQVANGVLQPQPLNLSACDETILLLYGTGLDKTMASGVQVKFGDTAGTVLYAGPQGTWPGLDQINVVIPQSLAQAGNVPITLTAGGMTANVVNVSIQ